MTRIRFCKKCRDLMLKAGNEKTCMNASIYEVLMGRWFCSFSNEQCGKIFKDNEEIKRETIR